MNRNKSALLVLVFTAVILFSAGSGAVSAVCVDLNNYGGGNEYIANDSVTICPGTYLMDATGNDGAIIINADDITVDCNGATIQGMTTSDGIDMSNHQNVVIKNCNILDYYNGIHILGASSNNNTLINNTANTNSVGIQFTGASNNTLINNTANTNVIGFYMSSSDINTLINNTAEFNGAFGFRIRFSVGNTLTNNTAKGNPRGISLNSSLSNNISNNTAISNALGIILGTSSNNNIITGNYVLQNTLSGINITADSENNLIYNNWVANNVVNAYDPDGASSNSWNTPKTPGINIFGGSYLGGNYWDDSISRDANGDGLGDTNLPYNSFGNIITGGDYAPLTSFSNCLNLSGLNEIVITSSMTLCPGTYPMNDTNDNGAIIIGADNVVLDCNGATLQGNSGGKGIFAIGRTKITIKGCNIVQYEQGIYLDSTSNNNLLTNNTAASNARGIDIQSSTNNTITNNTANSNTQYGISLSLASNNNTLTNNIANSNSAIGIVLSQSSNNTLTNNTANSNPQQYGILLDSSLNNLLTNNTANSNKWGIYLGSASNNNTLTNNTANSNLDTGIYLFLASNNNTLTNNNASSNTVHGIYLKLSSNNTLTNNNASSNIEHGIYLDTSSNYNTLINNIANSNTQYGIYLHTTSNNTLTNNNASSNNYGILLHSSSNTTLTSNTVTSNSDHGIAIGGLSYNNLLSSNKIKDNVKGITLDSTCEYNLIYNNYFSNNSVNAHDQVPYNYWNTSKTAGTNIIGGPYLGGNYWADYAGEDTDLDGLGDTLTPYNASENISFGGDYAPLIPIPPTAQISSISPSPAYPGDVITFNGSGTPGTQGSIAAYEWNSSVEGFLNSFSSFNISVLSTGAHNITLRVLDSAGIWSEPVTEPLLITVRNLNLSETSIDFGDVYFEQNVTKTITAENIGNSTFTNLTATSSDSLISAELENEIILSGRETDLIISLSIPDGATGGDFTSRVTVNGIIDGTLEPSYVTVSYSVKLPVGALTIVPASHNFGDVTSGLTYSKNFVLTNTGEADIDALKASAPSGTITNLTNTQLPVGNSTSLFVEFTVPALASGDYVVTVELSWGTENTTVSLEYTIPQAPEQLIPIVNPTSWNMGKLAQGATASQSFTAGLSQGSLDGVTVQATTSNSIIFQISPTQLDLGAGQTDLTLSLTTPSVVGVTSETLNLQFAKDGVMFETLNVPLTFEVVEDVQSLVDAANTRLNQVQNSLNNAEAQTTQGSKLYLQFQTEMSAIQGFIDSADSHISDAQDAVSTGTNAAAKAAITKANSDLAKADAAIKLLKGLLSLPQADFLDKFLYIFIIAITGGACAVVLVAHREGWIGKKKEEVKKIEPKDRYHPAKPPKIDGVETKAPTPEATTAEWSAEKTKAYYTQHPEKMKQWQDYYKAHPDYAAHIKQKYRSYEHRRYQ